MDIGAGEENVKVAQMIRVHGEHRPPVDLKSRERLRLAVSHIIVKRIISWTLGVIL